MKIKKINKTNEKISNFIYYLRNEKYVRKNSLKNSKILLRNHKIWFQNFFNKKNLFFLILEKKTLIGYVRLELNRKIYNTSWALLKKYHGKGYAKNALKYATKNKNLRYRALIKKNNLASLKIAFYSEFQVKKTINNIIYLYKN